MLILLPGQASGSGIVRRRVRGSRGQPQAALSQGRPGRHPPRPVKILANRPAPPHLVYISIVGCDRIPLRFYRAKYACELALERSKLPVTVVRATQFQTLIATIARTVTRGPLALVPRVCHSQPMRPSRARH